MPEDGKGFNSWTLFLSKKIPSEFCSIQSKRPEELPLEDDVTEKVLLEDEIEKGADVDGLTTA